MLRSHSKNISYFFSEKKITGIYINFPDPWDKKSWKKNRLINADYLQVLYKLLEPNGFIAYKTDHKQYFLESNQIFADSGLYSIQEYTEDLHQSPYKTTNIITEFEALFLSQNKAINYLKAYKLT